MSSFIDNFKPRRLVKLNIDLQISINFMDCGQSSTNPQNILFSNFLKLSVELWNDICRNFSLIQNRILNKTQLFDINLYIIKLIEKIRYRLKL